MISKIMSGEQIFSAHRFRMSYTFSFLISKISFEITMNRGIATMHRIGAFFSCAKYSSDQIKQSREIERFFAIVYVCTLAL